MAVPRQRLSMNLKTGLIVVTVGICVVYWISTREWLSSNELFRLGTDAVERDEIANAEQYAVRLLQRDPQSREGLYLKALTTRQAGSWREAVQIFGQIPDDSSPIAVKARCAAGDLQLFKAFQISRSEDQFRRAIEQDDRCTEAHNRLAYILGLQSRNWEALPHRLIGIGSESLTETDLYLVSLGDRAMDDPKVISQYLGQSENDPGALLGWGRVLAEQGDFQTAERVLKSVISSPKHAPEALSRWGLLLLAKNDLQESPEWHEAAQSVTSHPGVWYVRAIFAHQQADFQRAARCFWEVLLLDPEHTTTNYRLGQLLIQLDREEAAQPFLQRASQLEEYQRAAELAFRVGEDFHLKLARDAARKCGLKLETEGWDKLIWQLKNTDRHARDQSPESLSQLTGLLTRSDPADWPARKIDLSEWNWNQASPPKGTRSDNPDAQELISSIGFIDTAASAKMNFKYVNGGDPGEGLKQMFEVTGGGVSVLDFDRDEWPDLYFPQGGSWTAGDKRAEIDRLFRNLGNGEFAEVTSSCGITETGFSLGASVGDIDGDGFPDIYVTNSGRDSLYRNQGDGTFTDITSQAGIHDDDYGSSAVIADFSGDGLPDIYVVNYLAGDDLWERLCGGDDGIPRSCLPQSFSGATDRYLQNRGDGRFEDQTTAAGIAELHGKGLGIIAARFQPAGRLGIYIANDVGPNFLLQNEARSDEPSPKFIDVGLSTGSALSSEGRSQSGMGVAAGDIDGDGSLDLFVTNFEGETNTLYLQKEGLQFEDATVRCGLADPQRNLVGWGTQCFDPDLDGWLDIAITNGHVNNLSDRGKPYRMNPSFFQNRGGGQMIAVGSSQLGTYFARQYLGRGMARLDWNRDGLEDLIVTHLDVPAALLTNHSKSVGHGIRLFLSGVQCERDPIGAIIRVDTAHHTLTHQLTAGDGNQGTNQRCIVFGLGDDVTIQSVSIDWPNGSSQKVLIPEVDCDYRIVEGIESPYLLHVWP